MSYTSFSFVFLFLPLSIILYYISIKDKNNSNGNILLLVLSIFFYVWSSISTLAVLLLYVLFIYILAVAIEKSGKRKKKLKDTLAAISILVSLTMLAFYKYAKYYHASPFAIADTATEQPMVEIVVPLGLSFIVFSGISYSIDVYSGESCGTPLDVFTYMFFFLN